MEEAKQTISNLTSRLLDEEKSLDHGEQSENAFVATDNASKQDNHYKKSRFTCYNCGKKGHFARDYKALRKIHKTPFHKAINQGNAFNTEIGGLSLADTDSDWLMDSGASKHMCPNKQFFSSLSETQNLTLLF